MDNGKLKEVGKSKEMKNLFLEKIQAKGEADCINEKWENIRNSLKEAAKESIGIK